MTLEELLQMFNDNRRVLRIKKNNKQRAISQAARYSIIKPGLYFIEKVDYWTDGRCRLIELIGLDRQLCCNGIEYTLEAHTIYPPHFVGVCVEGKRQ